jgi:competence protein ComEA
MQSFDINELLLKFRYPLLMLLVGLILGGAGIFIFKTGILGPSTKVEILGENSSAGQSGEITVEIAGEVMNSGVYKLPAGSRIDDLLINAGGFSKDADRVWTDKYLNRAATLSDGEKIYIPSLNSTESQQSNSPSAKSSGGDQSTSSNFSTDSKEKININTASLGELDSLPGIGQVYGQNIIEHRPYSNTQELVSKGAIKQNLYEKIKDMVTIY